MDLGIGMSGAPNHLDDPTYGGLRHRVHCFNGAEQCGAPRRKADEVICEEGGFQISRCYVGEIILCRIRCSRRNDDLSEVEPLLHCPFKSDVRVWRLDNRTHDDAGLSCLTECSGDSGGGEGQALANLGLAQPRLVIEVRDLGAEPALGGVQISHPPKSTRGLVAEPTQFVHLFLGRAIKAGIDAVQCSVGVLVLRVGCHCGALALPVANLVRSIDEADTQGGKEGVTIRSADRQAGDLLRQLGDVTYRLQPCVVLRSAAHRSNDGRARTDFGKEVDVLSNAMSHAFQRGAEQLGARMGKGQAEDDALRHRVTDRRAFTGEVRQDDDSCAARGNGGSLPGKDRIGGLTAGFLGGNQIRGKFVPEPARERPARRHPSEEAPRVREEIRGCPEALVLGLIVVGDLDDEDGRAVHKHHLARFDDSNAQCFGSRISRPGDDRCAGLQAGGVGGLLRYPADDLLGPAHFREPLKVDNAFGHLGVPLLSPGVEERVLITGGEIVDDHLPGQSGDDKGGCRDKPSGLPVDLRLVLLDPQDFWAAGLGREHVCAGLIDRVRPVLGVEGIDLCGRSSIDAIQNAVAQRGEVLVDGEHVGPDRADAHGRHVVGTYPLEKVTDHVDHITPPRFLGVVLGPAGPRKVQSMGSSGGRNDRALRGDEGALCLIGADVNAEEQLLAHGVVLPVGLPGTAASGQGPSVGGVRLLHTSDWHLGRTFLGSSMHEYQAEFLDWLVGQVEELGVEAIVVAGDIYDRSVPPQQSVEILDDALNRLSAHCPVIVTSGNHDSPTRLSFGGPFFERGGVHLRCRLADIARPVVLTGTDGVTVAIYGLPYLEPDHHRAELGAERSHASVLTAAMDRVRTDLAGRRDLRSIAVGHAFVTGGEGSDSERDVRVGGIGDAPASVFAGVDYVALGHLHRAQRIPADDALVRYSGSPLAYSFSEEHHTKSVTLVDIPAEGDVSIREIPTPVPRRLATIRGTLAELLADPELDVHVDDWVRAVLTDERRPTDAMAQIRSRFPNALQLEFDRPLPDRLSGLVDVATADPVEVALGFVEHVTTTTASDAERAVLAEAIEDVRIRQVSQ